MPQVRATSSTPWRSYTTRWNWGWAKHSNGVGGVRSILCKSAPTETIAIEIETGVITGHSQKHYHIRYRVSIRASTEGVPQLPVEELTATDVASGQEFGFYTEQDRAIFFGSGEQGSGQAYNLFPELF